MSYNYDELVGTIAASRRAYYTNANAIDKNDNDNDQQQQQQQQQQLQQQQQQQQRLDHLQASVEAFETLSTSCPMTPLLWMQYAADTAELLFVLARQGNENDNDDENGNENDDDDDDDGDDNAAAEEAAALETRLQMLELAINEFPGSAILRLHYLELLSSLFEKQRHEYQTRGRRVTGDGDVDGDDGIGDVYYETLLQTHKRYEQALESALMQVGRGSHRNEAALVAKIYRLQAGFYASTSTTTPGRSEVEDNAVLESFVQRATTPMGDVNASLGDEYQEVCEKYNLSMTIGAMRAIEKGRRYEAKVYSTLVTNEDEVDVAMNQEGISPSQQVDLDREPTLDWNKILATDDKTCWMGLGGMTTAQAFIQYAQACFRFRSYKKLETTEPSDEREKNESDDLCRTAETQIKALAVSVYERGVAECPTVESLWLSYLRHLFFLIKEERSENPNSVSSIAKAKSVVDRAVRNCPYSAPLFQRKIRLALLQANAGQIVLDPDDLMKIVTEEALGAQFITSPQAATDLFLTVVDVLRKRLLVILATAAGTLRKDNTKANRKGKNGKADEGTSILEYDDAEPVKVPIAATSASKGIDEGTLQELEDLAGDLRDMYDEIETYLRKNHPKFDEGRSRLWEDRAYTETHLLGPLSESLGDGGNNPLSDQRLAENFRCYDKATKVHLPTQPRLFMSYIQAFIGACPVTNSPICVLANLRQVRFLYQKALKTTGKQKQEAETGMDFETSIKCLCHEYLEFERFFGSEQSFSLASSNVEKKLAKIGVGQKGVHGKQQTKSFLSTGMATNESQDLTAMVSEESNKRSLDADDVDAPEEAPKKKSKVAEAGDLSAQNETGSAETSDGTSKEDAPKKMERPKVKVGKLEYPAHPYTVRVSFLSPDTNDMDLVDYFRPKCGAIVHAKIMREKQAHNDHYQQPKSKGWALIQFEEKNSVDKALELSGVIGIHEKLVRVERSHVPAVGLVPPGLHRVNAKGQGKSTKRNLKRKEGHEHQQKQQKSDAEDADEGEPPNSAASKDADEFNSSNKKSPPTGVEMPGVLAFRPRGVASSTKRRKVKVSLSTGTTQKES